MQIADLKLKVPTMLFTKDGSVFEVYSVDENTSNDIDTGEKLTGEYILVLGRKMGTLGAPHEPVAGIASIPWSAIDHTFAEKNDNTLSDMAWINMIIEKGKNK
jgi:hypothetical protein